VSTSPLHSPEYCEKGENAGLQQKDGIEAACMCFLTALAEYRMDCRIIDTVQIQKASEAVDINAQIKDIK
jgi:hypothetical protein